MTAPCLCCDAETDVTQHASRKPQQSHPIATQPRELIHAFLPDPCLCCAAEADMASNGSSTPGSCADWEGNNSTLGFGGDLASEAAAINATDSQLEPITSFPSGGILPSLRFSVLDHFGNLVAGGLSLMYDLLQALLYMCVHAWAGVSIRCLRAFFTCLCTHCSMCFVVYTCVCLDLMVTHSLRAPFVCLCRCCSMCRFLWNTYMLAGGSLGVSVFCWPCFTC